MLTRLSQILIAIIALGAILPACSKDESPKPCEDRVILGKLVQRCDGQYYYSTSGGGGILINLESLQIINSHKDYENFKIEFWGGIRNVDTEILALNHENLKGKHIKNKLLPSRSLIFPDGTKLTISANAIDTDVHTISIYDGDESHQFDIATKTVKHSSLNASKAQELDNGQADGETCTFIMDDLGLEYYNIYHEETPGNKVNNLVPLGRIIRSEPTRVDDLYDDLRLGHT